MGWRNEYKVFRRGREFKLAQLQRKFLFLLRFFRRGNGFAQTTGMFAVEGLHQCHFERRFLRITHNHARPRDRLQHEPLRIRCREQCDDQEKITNPLQHIRSVTPICAVASKKSLNHLKMARQFNNLPNREANPKRQRESGVPTILSGAFSPRPFRSIQAGTADRPGNGTSPLCFCRCDAAAAPTLWAQQRRHASIFR